MTKPDVEVRSDRCCSCYLRVTAYFLRIADKSTVQVSFNCKHRCNLSAIRQSGRCLFSGRPRITFVKRPCIELQFICRIKLLGSARFDVVFFVRGQLKWAIAHPAVTCALPATTNPDHMSENIGALRGLLPDDAMRARMVRYVETIPNFERVNDMPWYPGESFHGLVQLRT